VPTTKPEVFASLGLAFPPDADVTPPEDALSALLLASVAALAAALLASIWVMLKNGETRVALLTGVFALLGVQQGVALWRAGDAPLGFDLATGAAAAGLAAGLLGLAAMVALARILAELDRAEMLHWESMEGVRGLTDLASRTEVALEQRLPLLLELGCERLGLEIGLVSRVRGERYEVIDIHAPESYPIAAGSVFTLDETPCRAALASERPVAVMRAAEAGRGRSARSAFGFEAYLGAAIRVRGEAWGTLVFASLEPRDERFTATHKDLTLLMAQWLGSELERQELATKARRTGSREGQAQAPRTRPAEPKPAAAELRVDAFLGRLERRIRAAVPEGVTVEIECAEDLEPARPLRIPLDAVVLSLVRRAAAGLPPGGTLRLSAAHHDPQREESGAMAAVAPDRYVTLSISESGGGLEADALSRVFEAEQGPVAPNLLGGSEGNLPLASVYRLVQRAGGDLSVELEPGRGSTFTLFLPRGPEAPAEPAPARTAVPAAAPPAGH
jgi:GAF domain-containing protein